jgi:proteasome assembly chaperone (PAC2) family protein
MDQQVTVQEAYFERVFNLGNYETCRIGLRATVGAKQTVEDVVAALDEYTVKIKNTHIKR